MAYIGFAFPFAIAASEFPKSAVDDDVIKASLIQLILTSTGERVMRPNLGGSVMDLLFENVSDANDSLLRMRVLEIISAQEQRVKVEEITVDRVVENEMSGAILTIYYLVVQTGKSDKVVVTLNQSESL